MINGAHVVLYSKDAEADRDFFRDVLGFPFVDAGHGWLIFALPPGEAAFHPAADPTNDEDRYDFFLMCDDLKSEIASLRSKDIACSEIAEARWGSITKIHLPGGGHIGLYEPKHPRP